MLASIKRSAIAPSAALLLLALAGCAVNGGYDPDRLAAAERLLDAIGVEKVIAEVAPIFATQFKAELGREHPGQTAAIEEIVDGYLVPEMVLQAPDLSRELAWHLASNLTDEEISVAVDFLTTPTGRNIAAKLRRQAVEIALLDDGADEPPLDFARDELEAIEAFASMPAAQRLADKMESLGDQAEAIGERWGERVADAAFRKAAPLLEQYYFRTLEI